LSEDWARTQKPDLPKTVPLFRGVAGDESPVEDSDNQVHEETDWMSIVIWKKETLATYLTKGTKLYVEGRLQTRSYDDRKA